MAITDPHGGEVRESSHRVKTLAFAQEWAKTVSEDDLPVTIDQYITGDGRIAVRVYNKHFKLIATRG